jgi:D-alanyl-D-alanine dipeptidase
MNLEKYYEALEEKFIKCRDLKDIVINELSENFISLSKLNHSHIKIRYEKFDMLNHFNGEMIVRSSVAQKILNIANHLKEQHSGLALIIVYGYRTDEIQKKYFFKYLRIIEEDYPWIEDKDELYELVHMGVACPNVAGHPTGGAVDIACNYETRQPNESETRHKNYICYSMLFILVFLAKVLYNT